MRTLTTACLALFAVAACGDDVPNVMFEPESPISANADYAMPQWAVNDAGERIGDLTTQNGAVEFRGFEGAADDAVTAFRVEAEGAWLEHVGGEAGTREGRSVRPDTMAATFGDTATVRYYDADDNLICNCLATFVVMTRGSYVADADSVVRVATWAVKAEHR